MAVQNIFFPYSSSANYKKFDVIRGTSVSDAYYFYATQDSSNQNPNSIFSYNVTSYVTDDNKTTVFFTKTGLGTNLGPNFAAGSLIAVSATFLGEANFTGMAINGGSGFVEFINERQYGNGGAGGLVKTSLSHSWTSGFMFIPSYSSSQEIKARKNEAKFGDGYSQRQRDGLNSVNYNWRLNFENRSDREARAISTFVEDKAGIEWFNLLMPVNNLTNNPSNRYIADSAQITTNSYNLNTISVDIQQVFDI